MLKIDLTSVEENKTELARLVSLYEQTSMNIILEFLNSDSEWKDENSGKFFGIVNEQKTNLKKFVSSLENIVKRYGTIISETKEIDGTIERLFFNQNFKSAIMSKYDTAISSIKNLASRLRGLSTYFCIYGERYSINSEASKIDGIASQLKASRDLIEKKFEKLSALETKISSLLTGIDVQPIPEIDVSEFLSL